MLIFSVRHHAFHLRRAAAAGLLPLNPQKMAAVSRASRLQHRRSFTTNTNWQSLRRRKHHVYFSQMVALAIHNFCSAAVGIAIAAALVRGIARHTAQTIGNFWVDLVRVTYYLCCPFAFSFARVPRFARDAFRISSRYDAARLDGAVTPSRWQRPMTKATR